MTDLYGNIPISGNTSKQPDTPPKRSIKEDKSTKKAEPLKPDSKSKTIYLVIPGIFLFLVASYYGLASFVFPLYLEKKLPDIFLKETGLSLSLGSAQFNPLNSTLVVQNLNIDSLNTASEDNDILDIGNIVIDFDLASIWERAIITEAIHINAFQLNVLRYHDNSYNVSNLLPDSEQTITKLLNSNALGYPYSFNNLAVDGGTIIFNDMSTSTVHRVEQLQLRLPTLANFSYALDDYVQPEFSAIINGSPLKLTSGDNLTQTTSEQQATRLTLDLQSVDLPLYANYLPFQLPIVVKAGKAEIQTEISFQNSKDSNFQLNFDFQAQIIDGMFTSRDETLILNTPSLRLEGAVAPLDRQISLENLLLQDPLVTVNNSFSATTVDSLFFKRQDNDETIDNYLHSTKLAINLLIADNGKVVLKTGEAERTFDQIQMSMRNFLNFAAREGGEEKNESSFLISGESLEESYDFSWQGNFDKSMPAGNIEINNFPASEILAFISTDTKLTAEGAAEIRGRLKLGRSDTSPVAYIFDNGTVILSPFNLKEKDRELLQSPSVKLSPVQISDKTIDLGNIFIERGKLNISREDLQTFFLKSNKERIYAIKGIDFNGDISLLAEEKDASPLEMNNARLQFKEVEDNEKSVENFAFSTDINSTGSITAKGHMSVAPIEGTIDLAIANMPVTTIIPPSLSKKYGIGNETTISTTGRYSIKSHNFSGAAEISKGFMSNPRTGTKYAFDRAVVGELSINQDQKSANGSKVILQGLSINAKTSQLESRGGTISSFSFRENDIHLGDISLAETRFIIPDNFTKAFSPILPKSESKLSIDELKMFGNVFVGDLDKITTPYIDNFSVTLRELQTGGKITDNLEFSATIQEKGTIEAKGAFTILPLRSKLNLTFEDIPAEILDHFTTPLTNLNIDADMRGQLTYAYPEKIYTGNVSFANGRLLTSSTPEIRWAEVSLADLQLHESPFRIIANRCLLKQPQASFIRSNTDIIRALGQNIALYLQQIENIKKTQDSPLVDIKRVDIMGGMIKYTDQTMRPAWQTELTRLEAGIDNFHIGDTAAKIDYSIRGDILEGAFSLTGSHQPSAENPSQLQTLEIVSLPLTEIEQQLSSSFDLTFEDSLLSLSLKNTSISEYFADLAISSINASDPESATALTLALLSYDYNAFSATIPLQQSNQTILNQATSYFQRLIVKAGVSPYLLLVEPFNSLEANQTISFDPGTAELSGESENVLTNYAMLLQNHPRLMLKLQPTVQRSADTIALREILTEREDERVRKENERLLQEWQQQQLNTVIPANPDNSIAVEDIPTEQLVEFTPITSKPIVVTEDMLEELAIERADKVRNFILGFESLQDNAVQIEYQAHFLNTLDLPTVGIELAHRDDR